MDEQRKKNIEEKANQIRVELAKGTLYGEPIDLTNEDMLLVASYYMGRLKED